MKPSKKHHYIPQFYLKGFTDENNQYYVFDKILNKIWKSSPENTFCENHRNTGEIKHAVTGKIQKTDMPEQFLGYFDGRVAQALKEIRDSKPTDDILTVERLYLIKTFIHSIFWRIPSNDELRNKLIKENSFEDLGFGIFDKEGNRKTETEKLLLDIDLWIKMYPSLLPVAAFLKKFNKSDSNNWKLYYRSNNFHVITDNPIMLKEFVDLSSLHEEVLFQVSSQIIILSTKRYKPRVLPPLFNLKLDAFYFLTAKRYIASSNKTYLELLINLINSDSLKYQSATKLRDDIFNYFY